MLKKRSRLLSIFLVLCFVITLFPLSASAEVATYDFGKKELQPKFTIYPYENVFTLENYWKFYATKPTPRLGGGTWLGETGAFSLTKDKAVEIGMESGWYNFVPTYLLEEWTEVLGGKGG